jgi:hypothetical protein
VELIVTNLDTLKQAIEDAVKPASDHEAAVASVRAVVSDIRLRCPGLQLECVFHGLPVGGGSYVGSESQQNAAELMLGLSNSERVELRGFVEAKLGEAEQFLAAA